MPVDSGIKECLSAQITQNFCNDRKSEKCSDLTESTADSEQLSNIKDSYIISESEVKTPSNIVNGNQKLYDHNLASVRPKAFSDRNSTEEKLLQSFQPNKWRRMVGFAVSENELKSALFSRKLKSKRKLRFAQAKKHLNHLYSYFSVKILECEKQSVISIGVSRKDFPNTFEIGRGLGSVGFDGGSGQILCPNEENIQGLKFSKGDVVGCGILFPPHYRRYADLSTDDSSDGMTDVVLSSLLNVNKKSMDFVQNVLGLKCSADGSSSEEDVFPDMDSNSEETDYYNANYVESRTKVEVYFTVNMQIVGKISTCVPIGGFYPTIQVLSPGEVWLQFDFN